MRPSYNIFELHGRIAWSEHSQARDWRHCGEETRWPRARAMRISRMLAPG
jgi:hypothetical protein